MGHGEKLEVEIQGKELKYNVSCHVSNSTLKLHATLMNARHRKRGKWTKRLDSFDARGIMKQYGSEEWGEYPIPEVHLSEGSCLMKMGTATAVLPFHFLKTCNKTDSLMRKIQ